MKRRISVLAFLALLGVLTIGRADTPPSPSSAAAQKIQELIRQLGAEEFPARERAAQELEQIGVPALELLRQATKSNDLEIRRTAEELVTLVQARALASTMLAPRKVSLDLKAVPLPEVLAQLSRQSGYALQLAGNPADLAAQKITLQARDMPFWQVLEQVRRQAGLTEQRSGNRAGRGETLVLTPGKEVELAAGSAGAVRLAILPASLAEVRPQPGKDGEVVLVLEATAEPRLKGFGMVGVVRVDRAIDDQGQVRQVAGIPETAAGLSDDEVRGGAIFIGGRRLANVPETANALQQVPLRVQPGEKPARRLRELTGAITAQVFRDVEEDLIVVDNILKAAGVTAKGKKGEEIEIQSVTQQEGGDVQVQALLRNLEQAAGLPGINIRGNVMIRGNVRIRGARVANSIEPARLPRLLDTQGQTYQLADHEFQGVQISPAGVAHQVLLTYRPGAGQKEPAKLVLRGQQLVVFEVPFTLKDIPLP